ncbi:MAG TPA: cadherin-like beta sandwich domain-containing protein [Candidatus Aphodoplasma excrementigallinarum]|uniref:Cadherin-like beta sandwich domain-containing protein n=1 Tax=Candidatus Aphodoplasma excrementigallinarum TaxID=2840673 RepID=A0A9D1NIR4_9FIRM|nr:cadherin-like beta sandwich domain-containing protein [Candidatus Aphodoplasma excrementigallinarum]
MIGKGVTAPTVPTRMKLSSLTYTLGGGSATSVPDFDAADEGGEYNLTFDQGTTSVTIAAVAEEGGTATIMVGEEEIPDGIIDLTNGSATVKVVVADTESGRIENIYTIDITVEGVNRVTNMSTAATAGVYTENGGYTTEQVPSISGKYAVTDGLIPGTTSRYTSESTTNPRAVSANTNSYFNGATVIRGDRNDRTSSPGGNWANRPYYVGTSGNPDAYNGKDDNGYWLEFTVTSACTVFQTLTGPVNTGGVWPNAPEAPEEWTKNTKANFLLDASSDFYYRHYEAGETVRIPNFGKIGTWVSGEGGTAWYEAPTWFIVWDSTGKVNPAEASDVAKLSSLQYTVADGVATDVPGFDAAAEGGSYNLTLGEGTTSVTITAATQKNGTATVMVDNEAVAGGVIDLTEGAATVKVVVSSESGLVSNAFTINITVEGAEIVNQILNLTEAEPNASTDLQMKADTIVFGTTSPYLLYSVGEANNADGTNTGAAIYGASNSPEFFEGATAIRRNKGDAFGSNNTDAPTAKYWGNPVYSGKDDNGYYLTFEVSSDATVYVVDREGKGWPNKPDDWQTSKYKFGSAGNMTMFYKTFTAGETVQIPNYGWNNSWTTLTSDRAFKDPSFYVVVWGESPETAEPEPEPEPTEVIFEDDFEGYDVNTPISNTVKGWDAIYDNSASFIAVANPDGGQMAQAKALTKMVDDDEDPATPEVDKGQKYPVMHKNVNNIQETLSASEMEAIAIGGKVQIHNTADTKPSHYIELRNTANNDTSKRLTTLSITTDSISFFGTKEVPNVIGSATPDTWIDYTVYIVPGASGEETQFTVVLTGEGLKDADGTPTDRIVATKSQVYNVIADDNAVRVLYNNNIARDDGSYVNLDELKIFATNVPEIEPEPEENAKLSALTYTVDSTTTSVPGFSATDEGGEYAAIELPYGTTSVTVGATRADDNASVTISPENPIAVSSAAETVVTVTVTNGDTTNTFKLTFTVAAQEPQPTEEIFSDDFEAYGLDTALDKATKGWDAVNQTANFTAVTNPAGNGQVAEVKWSADASQETYPSLRKNVGMQAGETYAISGKIRIADAGGRKPSHYVEFRTTPAGGEEIKQITLRINNGMISLLDGNVIGSTPSESTWISYTLYVTPGVAETKIVAEVTGVGLKDVNGNDTDKVVAGITLARPNFVPESGTQTVVTIFNNQMGAESDARIYLDDIVISKGATAPTLSSDTNLSSLKYAPNGSNATDVPGFAEDKTDYGTIELPYGTASVTVTAVTKDANARTSVMVGEDEMAGGVVTVSPDAATDVVVVVTAQDGTKREITMSFTVAEEPEPEPTEIISDLTYATSNTPTLTQIELGVTESYTNADGCVITTASSAEFEGAYVLQKNKGADTPTPSSTAPYYAGAYDGQGDNPYWMTFTMNVPGTVYVADMEGKGWKNRGDWSVDTSGLTFGIWEMTINGSSGRLFSKHFNAGDTVQVPNYGWDESWGDATKRIFTNPSIYLIVPDSNLTKSASLKSLTYTVGDGSAVTVPDFVSGSTATNTFDVTISDMSAAVKVAAEGITNANASISYSANVDTDGTVTFDGNTAQVVVTVKSADGSVTNTYTINFTKNADPMAGAKTYDVPSHEGTTIDILVNPGLTAIRANTGNNEIKPTEPINNLSKFYSDRGDTGADGKTPGMAFTDVGAAIMGATQLINPIGDTPGRTKDEALKAFTGADNEYFRFRANEAGTVYVKFDRDIASYETDPSWTKVVEPSTGLAGMGDWGANGLPDEYVHNYEQYPYYCNMYQNASGDANPANYATRYTVTYYKSFAANEVVTIRTINSTNNQNLITLIQWGEDVPSYNTALASLTYNGISVPNFSADTKDYTIYMPTADAVSIAAVAAESGMNVSYSKQSLTPSAAGDTATITVSNSEGTQTVYTVKAILDATANKVLNLSSASRADVQENLVIGASNGAGGSLAYIDRDNVLYTDGTSTFFEGATYIRSAKDDGNAVYSTKPYFSETYNGKDGNPYWLEFVVSSDCRIFFADTYYNADLTNEGLGMQEFAQPWPNKPEGWITAAPTDDVDIVSTHFQAKTENGSVYYKDFKAGDVVQIPNYGAPSYWADDRAPWDPPVYLIVWGSDIKNPGIDDGGDVGGDTGDEGGIEEGGQDPNPWQ